MLLKQIICYFAAIMKCPFYIFFLLYGTFWFASCTGPVILEEKEGSDTQTEQENTPNAKDTVAIVHEGSYSSPYSIAEAQTLGHGKNVWIEGYIVGSVKNSMKSGCNFTAETAISSNILLADTFLTGDENDYLLCLPIDLTSSSARDELNLSHNPQNFHRKIRLLGTTKEYFKVIGIKDADTYVFCDEIVPEIPEEPEEDMPNEEDNNDNDPNKPHDPNATRKDTLSIAEGIELQSDREYHHVYIKGYIIGYTTSNRKIYDSLTDIKETSARSNIVLADNIEESNPDNMIAVELKGGSYIQQTVNLVDNPQNFHKRLTVKGAMKEYRKLHGCIDIPNGLIQENDTIKDYYFLLE